MIELIILILSTYAISALLTRYDGAGHIFLRLRNKYPDSALQCAVCTSCYVIIPLFIIYTFGYSFWLIPAAVIGAMVIIDEALK